MRIAVLAHNLRVAGGLAVGRNLVATLPVVGPNHNYLMVIPAGLEYETHKDRSNVRCIEISQMSFLRRIYFDLYELRKEISQYKPDVILGLGNLGLTNPGCTQAILFHNPHMIYPSKHYSREIITAKFKNWMLKRRLKACLRSTQLMFCQTPVAKNRFAEEFAYPPERIEILPNAVSEFVKLDRSNVKVPSVLRDSKYFNMFFLARYCAHKNFEVLLDLYDKYNEELKDTRCIITIIAKHPNAAKFLKEIHRRRIDSRIVNVGTLKDDELAGYFYNCDALLFPTMLESFSGTYLEAMHFGLPILTSDLDFARYICGDAALYFSPWNPADIVDKITKLKNTPSIRGELVSKGSKRLHSFFRSWDEIAIDALHAIEHIAK